MSAADRSKPEAASRVGLVAHTRGIRQLNEGRRTQFLFVAALYLIAVIYVSIAPFHYVPVDLAQAWRDLLSVTFNRYHYADQRADLMGNVLMLMPLGFALAAAFSCESSLVSRWVGSLLALVISFVLIVAIKYLQLFFPPRTVDLNYIVAQTTGAFIGVLLWAILRPHLSRFAVAIHFGGRQALITGLTIYTAALVVFTFFPFNIVLNVEDFVARLTQIHQTVFALPGSGRPGLQRLVLVFLGLLSTVPVGVLLAFVWREAMNLSKATIAGLLLSGALFLAGVAFVDFIPTFIAVLTHTAGVIVGALLVDWLRRWQTRQLETLLRFALRWLVLPYLLLVFLLNDLASRDWRSLETALAQSDWIWTLPLVRHYYVSKAAAAASIVAHFLIYAPMGAIVWAYWGPRGWLAALCGGGLALMMEIGRFFKPGLAPDSTNIITAATAAAALAALMPRALLWIGSASYAVGDRRVSQRPTKTSSHAD